MAFIVSGKDMMKRVLISLLLLVLGLGGFASARPYDDALKAERQRDYKTAFRLLLPLARQGNMRAQYKLGQFYSRGRGVAREYNQAAKWYARAAGQGYSLAQFSLGTLYITGKGVPKDFHKATSLFRKSADKGHIGAQYMMGLMYRKGSGIRQDNVEAARWFRKSAKMGHANAQYSLGILYNKGLGVPKSYGIAVKWFRLSANQKHSAAMGLLGAHYTAGWGVPKSNVRAYMWFTLGDRYGSKPARKARIRIKRRMTEQQISTATILAKYWKPKSNVLIKISQKLLIRLGYRVAVADGLKNRRTRRAIIAYQKNKGLTVTGNVSTVLIKNMISDLGSSRPPSEVTEEAGKTTPRISSNGRPGRIASRRNDRIVRKPARPRTTTGTGFVVSPAGHLLTNRHVVAKCNGVKIRWADGDSGTAKILSISKNADLALLKTTSKVTKIARFRSGKRLRQGEDIAVYGFPLTGLLSSSGNLTTGSVAALAGLRDDASIMQISAPVQPGNSGGPVFDKSGRIVGVVVSKLNAVRVSRLLKDIPQNINFAIKASVATNFLESRGVPYEIDPGGAQRSNADNTDAAKAFTVRIQCSF